jgi:hypothetical protein
VGEQFFTPRYAGAANSAVQVKGCFTGKFKKTFKFLGGSSGLDEVGPHHVVPPPPLLLLLLLLLLFLPFPILLPP